MLWNVHEVPVITYNITSLAFFFFTNDFAMIIENPKEKIWFYTHVLKTQGNVVYN